MRFLQSPETFTVEELPLYAPSGTGEHLYVTFRRRGLSTPHVLSQLQRALGLKEAEIGCAGNKDRDATAAQTLSLPIRAQDRLEEVFGALGAEVLSAVPHPHKLRTGKLAGNRFTVVLDLDAPEEADTLRAGCTRLEAEGLPNAFGPQRFGDSDAVETGLRLFLGTRPPGAYRRARFAVSAFQAALFNDVLAERRRRGLYPGPLAGDLMKRHDSGGEFVAAEEDDNTQWRVRALEISPTGPMVGRKMTWPSGAALDLELEALARFGLNQAFVAAAKAPGARRFLRVPTGPVEVHGERLAASLRFKLPPGSYATVLLMELGVRLVRSQG